MNGVFGICFKQIERKLKVKRDKNKLVRMIHKANKDPLYEHKRQGIISQIKKRTDLDILEISEFNLVELVGSGASSDVCLVVRKEDRQKFAVKFIKHEISTKEFVNEATLLKSCSNVCATIVNLVGIVTTPRCLVFEFHANGSLDQALKKDNFSVTRGEKTKFPFLRRLGYILDMCRAVHQLHRENICHRDIAMRNLLLSDDSKHVLLSDFSLSRVMSTALVTQSTLTTLVPTKSAPETVKQSSSPKYGRENFERYYSLKSDIWSLGVSMFEIIDKEELGDIEWGKKIPNGFSEGRVPPTNVFNRMQDIWILILRCWNESPQDRPQIWTVQERIETLLADPLNVGRENDGYTRTPNKNITRVGSTFDNQRLQSCYSWSGTSDDCNLIDTVLQYEWRLDSGNLYSDSPMSWPISEEESTKSITPSIPIGFSRKLSIGGSLCDIQIQEQSSNTKFQKSQKRYRENRANGGNYSNMHLSPPLRKSTPTKSEYSRHMNRNHQLSLNFPSWRNISDSSISNTHLSAGSGVRYLKRLKSSIPSNSISSQCEESFNNERVEYCPPLSLSFNSTATNTRYCKDRHFFNSKAIDLNMEEKPYTPDYICVPDTPESEAAGEQSATYDLSNMLRFAIAV